MDGVKEAIRIAQEAFEDRYLSHERRYEASEILRHIEELLEVKP